jgi:predicted metal-dependent hydrolase
MFSKKEETYIEYTGRRIPFVIIYELRRSVRVAFGSKAITLRIPWVMTADSKLKHIEKSKQWAVDQLRVKPGLITNFVAKHYHDSQVLKIGDKKYVLYIQYHDRKTNKAVVKGQLLEIHLSTDIADDQKPEILRYLISRTIANDCYPEIAKRVHELNELHFKKKINEIRLKLSQTNWGSCSTQGNINLSARLLFAPQAVIDYVIIHELSHLIEHNHSDRFWTIVAKVMPEYEKYEKWLKVNSHLCEF